MARAAKPPLSTDIAYPQIFGNQSRRRQVGAAGYGEYTSTAYETSWSDGTPLITDGAEHGYVWANGTIGAGYSFTAPADTTTRTIDVYVGGFSSGSTLMATSRDESPPPITPSAFPAASTVPDIVSRKDHTPLDPPLTRRL